MRGTNGERSESLKFSSGILPQKMDKMSHNCRESVLIRHEFKIFIDRPDGDHYRGGPT